MSNSKFKIQNSKFSDLLGLYRAERAGQPQFYYNELAERGRALAELRAPVENFLQGRISLADFVRRLARQSRREVSAARGRRAGRYWRFNSAGRLFLEGLYKQSEKLGRLNSASAALQALLVAPVSLDAAGRQLNSFAAWLGELNSQLDKSEALRSGLLPYIASYFWAVQQFQQWPVYDKVAREQLGRAGWLDKSEGDEAGQYQAFYLAFSRLAAELDLPMFWELESFLHWLAGRDLSARRLLSGTAPSRKSLAELQTLLEPLARAQIEESLVSQEAPEAGRLTLAEPERPVQLELRLASGENSARAGAHFEGFNPAALATATGGATLEELQGFLAGRPQYHFYNARQEEQPDPTLTDLSDEFWLLYPLSLSQSEGTALVESLVSEWKLLYSFARRLIAPYDENEAPLAVTESAENAETEESAAFSYAEPAAASELKAVADTAAVYEAASEEPAQVAPAPVTTSNEAANQEARRLARFKPAPLTSDQLAALVAYIRERLVISAEKVTELVTHLEAGRNLLLYGPPGSGKTRLARLLAGQLCAPDPGWTPENEATSYALTTATAEWSQYDTIGGIRPGLANEASGGASLFYYFEPGVVARAALACEESLRRSGRPYYLIIDEFNRANQERAFGELFTLLEYRDRPLLPAARLGRPADLFIPDALRIIGTLNADDRNTLFELGQALRRRFALVEIGLPPPAEERRFLPRAVKSRLPSVVLTPEGEFAEPALAQVADKLTLFLAAVRPDPANPSAGGKEVGTAPLIESLLFCAVATSYYDLDEALEDAILANILPQLEGAPQAIKRALAVVAPGGALAELARVRATLERMSGYF